jgi:hypothetical protein
MPRLTLYPLPRLNRLPPLAQLTSISATPAVHSKHGPPYLEISQRMEHGPSCGERSDLPLSAPSLGKRTDAREDEKPHAALYKAALAEAKIAYRLLHLLQKAKVLLTVWWHRSSAGIDMKSGASNPLQPADDCGTLFVSSPALSDLNDMLYWSMLHQMTTKGHLALVPACTPPCWRGRPQAAPLLEQCGGCWPQRCCPSCPMQQKLLCMGAGGPLMTAGLWGPHAASEVLLLPWPHHMQRHRAVF